MGRDTATLEVWYRHIGSNEMVNGLESVSLESVCGE